VLKTENLANWKQRGAIGNSAEIQSYLYVKIVDITEEVKETVINPDGIEEEVFVTKLKEVINVSELIDIINRGISLQIKEFISANTNYINNSIYLYQYEYPSGINKGTKVAFDGYIEIPIIITPNNSINLGTKEIEDEQKVIGLIINNYTLPITADKSTLLDLQALNVSKNQAVNGFLNELLSFYCLIEENGKVVPYETSLDATYVVDSNKKVTYKLNGLDVSNQTRLVMEFDKEIISGDSFVVDSDTNTVCTVTIYGADGLSSITLFFNMLVKVSAAS